ncbi:MAG: cyclic lactone autoinducer peptide [Lachnospiraceae bacterium]|nr:cyclic lactone autoinducer peptide [Lachnospiraceae bacterium]
MHKFLFSLLGVVNAVALMAVTFSANSACCWVFHQPEFPAEANAFKK